MSKARVRSHTRRTRTGRTVRVSSHSRRVSAADVLAAIERSRRARKSLRRYSKKHGTVETALRAMAWRRQRLDAKKRRLDPDRGEQTVKHGVNALRSKKYGRAAGLLGLGAGETVGYALARGTGALVFTGAVLLGAGAYAVYRRRTKKRRKRRTRH